MVEWVAPETPNGEITQYLVFVDPVDTEPSNAAFSGLALSTTVTNLSPFTEYSVVVAACTSAGCTMSDNVVRRTETACKYY